MIDGLEFGGGERVFLQLASGLKKRYKILVATNTDGKFAHDLKELGIELFSLDLTRQVAFKPIRQIRDIIRRNKIDLVHSQGARADFFTRVAASIADSPHVLCTVAMPVEGFDVGPLRKSIYRLLEYLSGRFVKRFIVVSDSLKRVLIEERRISSERVVRIYNGIEMDQYHPDLKKTDVRNQLSISNSEPLIGAIGRMVWQKGFEFLIRAIPEILEVAPETRFLLVGQGPLRADLESLARQLNVSENIRFAGFRSDIQHVLSAIDILVVPSILEGFPIITLEAMAMEKPIVATRISGISEQVADLKEAILVPPKNSSALATASLRLIEDKKLASRLGMAARKKIERCFSIEKMIHETEQVYLSLLKTD